MRSRKKRCIHGGHIGKRDIAIQWPAQVLLWGPEVRIWFEWRAMGYTCLSSSGGSMVCPPLIHHYLSCSLSLSVNLQISFLEHFCSPFLLSAWNPRGNSHFGVTVSRVWYSDWGTQGLLEGPFMGSLVFSLRIFSICVQGSVIFSLPPILLPCLPPSSLFPVTCLVLVPEWHWFSHMCLERLTLL